MRSWYSYLAFFLTASAVLGGAHYYLWRRLVRDLHLPREWRVTLTVLLFGALGVLIAAFPLYRFAPPWLQTASSYAGFGWMGVMFLLLVFSLARDAVHVAVRLVERGTLDRERRLFLQRSSALSVAALTGGISLVSVREALSSLHVRELEIKLARLPEQMSGLKLVQLTDIHVGPTIGRDFVEEVVRKTNRLAPDLVAITGDLMDGSVAQLGPAVAPLGTIKSKYGTFFVPGNHEYYSGLDSWLAFLRSIGIRTLMNERVTIGDGENAIDLAGLDDETGRPDAAKALAGRNPERALVVLAHQPRTIKQVAPFGAGALQLSGHTHAGQIWPWNYLVYLQQPYVGGLHRHGDMHIYVSPGTGYWGPPMRLGTQAEITQITLV